MAFVDLKPKKSLQHRLFGRPRSRPKSSQTYWTRVCQYSHPDYSSIDREQRVRLLRKFGDFSIAYSTAVQPLMLHHGDENGYIAYRSRFGVTIALGDPVVRSENRAELIKQCVADLQQPVFCQVSLPTAEVLSRLGYYVNEFGVDTRLDLDEFTFDGKEKEWLRYASNWIKRRDYRVIESNFGAESTGLPIDVDRVEEISEAWRRTRTIKRKEVRFLNRPIVLEPEQDVRRFFLVDSAQQLLAFVFLDPLYRDGEIAGYVTSFKRRHPDAPLYAEQAIMKAIIESLKAEQIPKLMLGLSPMAWLGEPTFRHSWFTRRVFGCLFHSRLINQSAYNLHGHAVYKRRFRGHEQKVYFASKNKITIRQLTALVGLCGVT